jgi:hypothetical protein
METQYLKQVAEEHADFDAPVASSTTPEAIATQALENLAGLAEQYANEPELDEMQRTVYIVTYTAAFLKKLGK